MLKHLLTTSSIIERHKTLFCHCCDLIWNRSYNFCFCCHRILVYKCLGMERTDFPLTSQVESVINDTAFTCTKIECWIFRVSMFLRTHDLDGMFHISLWYILHVQWENSLQTMFEKKQPKNIKGNWMNFLLLHPANLFFFLFFFKLRLFSAPLWMRNCCYSSIHFKLFGGCHCL